MTTDELLHNACTVFGGSATLFDPYGQIIRHQSIGTSKEAKVIGTKISQWLHPEDEAAFQVLLNNINQNPFVPLVSYLRLKNRHNLWQYYELCVINLQLVGGIGANLGLTRSSGNQQGLADGYQLIIEELPQPVMGLRPDGTFYFANRAARELCANPNSPEKINADNSPLLLLANEAVAEQRTIETEIQLRDKLFRMKAIPRKDENNFDYAILIGTDITQLVEIENRYLANIEEMQRIRRAFDKSAIVSETDHRGIITFANDTFVEVSGFSREELLGRTHRLIKSDYHPPEFFAHLWQTIRSGKSWRGEICNRAKDGTTYWVDSFIHPITDASGKITRFIAVRYLITEKKQAEEARNRLIEQIQRRNADLENFSYVLSHNIRSPVANILGLLHIFEGRDELSDFNQQILSHLDETAAHLDEMIRDLNYILQVRRTGTLPTETIHLKELIEKVQHTLAREIRDSGAVIDVDLTNCTTLQSNPAYLHSILFNLFSNAIKYHRPGKIPLLKLSARKEKGEVILTMQDNGIGMDLSHDPERIFGLYTRLTSEKQGKGIGLYLVKEQVTALGGTIAVESKPGKGSTFTIRLPVNYRAEEVFF